MYYTKITDASFLPDLLNDGDVWPCNIVTAKWVVDQGYGFFSDSAGVAAVPPWDNPADVPAPTYEAGVILDADPTKIAASFTGAVQITDATGLVVNVDGSPVTLNGVTATSDELSITLLAGVVAGEVVTIDYDAATGNLVADGTGNAPVGTFVGASVVNGVL